MKRSLLFGFLFLILCLLVGHYILNSPETNTECLAHVFPPQHSAVLRRPKALQLQAFCGCLLIFQWLHRSPKSSLLTQLGEN